MEKFFKDILDYLLDFISQYSYFITLEYYKDIFWKYVSFVGFFVGLAFVLVVYFSSTEENSKTGFFKVIPFIALINSCAVLSSFLNTTFDQGVTYKGVEAMFNAPDNIISGFILTLVISSCYRNYCGRAFLFGIAAHTALLCLNYSYVTELDGVAITLMIVRVVFVAFLCLIMSYRKYFYTSWIWYFGYHMFLRTVSFLMPLLSKLIIGHAVYKFKYTVDSTMEYFSHFTMDAIIFVVILVFAIVFERGVLTVKTKTPCTTT